MTCSCSLWRLAAGLALSAALLGCQSSSRGTAAAPSFGVDYIPRQSEPTPEPGDVELVAADERSPEEGDEPEPDAPAGNPLARLFPGRGKESAERKPLPVTGKSAPESEEDW